MIKRIIEYVFSSGKAKAIPEQKTDTSFVQSIKIVDNESATEAIRNGKTEVLADGFVYQYPISDGNTTIFPNNIQNAVQFMMSAKTQKEKNAKSGLYHQVMERETKLMMESLQRKIEREIAEGR